MFGRYLLFLATLMITFCVNAQHDEFFYPDEIVEDDQMKAILAFEKYNPIVGGDSLRMCNGRKCTGIITDKYPDGKIQHKGYYNNGQLLNGYENFFENGQLERKFKTLASNKGSVVVYYADGGMRSEIVYFKGQVMLWKDYYPNGNLEYWEEYDRTLEYYVTYHFYYINGNPQSTMDLVDKKTVVYDAVEYYNNGNMKAKGKKKWAPGIGGYVKVGKWTIYDIEEKIIRTEHFEAGDNNQDDGLDDL